MFFQYTKKSFLILSAFLLVACGGGGDTSIASPGELGSLSDPTGGGGTGGVGSNVRNGTCPDSDLSLMVHLLLVILYAQLLDQLHLI